MAQYKLSKTINAENAKIVPIPERGVSRDCILSTTKVVMAQSNLQGRKLVETAEMTVRREIGS